MGTAVYIPITPRNVDFFQTETHGAFSMSAKQKPQRIVSPRGIAAYSWLLKPDTAFEQNKYKVTVLLDKTIETNQQFAAEVEAVYEANSNGLASSPIKDGDMAGKDGWEGNYVFTAKSDYKPTLVDSERNILEDGGPTPMSGDVVSVAMQLAPYDAAGKKGLSLRLTAVQLLEKRNTGGGAENIFEKVEGGFVVPPKLAEDAAQFEDY